jgi:hypothetical protein
MANISSGASVVDVISKRGFPTNEFALNTLAIAVSLVAIVFWIKLYRRVYKENVREVRGWSWLFASAVGILLLNVSSIYMLFNVSTLYLGIGGRMTEMDFNTMELLGTIARTLIGVSMMAGAYLLYSPMEKGLKYKFVPITPVDEKKSGENAKYMLEKGHAYLICEEKPFKSTEIFIDLVTHGFQGLYITRANPTEVRQKYKLEKTPILWLTDAKDYEKRIEPFNIMELGYTVGEFTKKTENGVILLDGLEYLIIQNDYKRVLKLIHLLEDFVSLRGAILLIPLDPATLEDRELHLLKREMTILWH